MNQEKKYQLFGEVKTISEWVSIFPNFGEGIFECKANFKPVEERNKVFNFHQIMCTEASNGCYSFLSSIEFDETLYPKISAAIEAVINEDMERTPLLTTDDGVKMYESNDTIWCVFELYKTEYAVGNWIERAKKDKVLQILSTKEAAEKWEKENT
jgi:hypothetical protein